ncbi:MAG: UDP-N-acetylmuramoyl-L-alanine--D-glutamate ligase [Planctomycetes bacterium]|nr:UDP-N-acetylmuramoyl-L-alanine--D-glutamate ligase [Planctomycetota bacterium]
MKMDLTDSQTHTPPPAATQPVASPCVNPQVGFVPELADNAWFSGKRVTVMGIGHFGGGTSTIRWLASLGADVLATDMSSADKLADQLTLLQPLIDKGHVKLALGAHNVSDFTTSDLVIVNPAVPKPWENRFLRAAIAAGVPITTEINLVVQRLPRREHVVAITGSAGKSTTSAMIHHILASTGRKTCFGGNIGGSLLDHMNQIQRDSFIVLELSSAMLHWLHGWSPRIAVVTNLAENHIDWHGSFDHYRESKRAIIANQKHGDAAVLGPGMHGWATRPGVCRIEMRDVHQVADIHLPGVHNRRNAAVAVAAAIALDPTLDHATAESAVRKFSGLPHRLERVGTWQGKKFFNDSKSTTPASTLLALDAVGESGLDKIHLIAGGYDKGSDLTPIGALAPKLAGLYTIGATGPAIAAVATATPEGAAHHTACETLDRAVNAAIARMTSGDILLLSTACASWGQFTNYEARGKLFCELVRAHFGAQPGEA